MDRKWMILLVFFSVATLTSSIICSSLVYHSENNKTEATSNQVLASNNTYKSTSITYYQDNHLKLAGLNPGYNASQKFTITNNNSNTIKYNIEWDNVSSTWNTLTEGYTETHPEEFVYSISCSNGEKIENKKMPITESDYHILDNLELKTNKSNDCTITISFLNKNMDQSYNLNKSFGGTYKVKIIN